MLDTMSPSQQMFMLFFSILYGIMLNSLIGLGAFPIGHALAKKDVIGRDLCGRPRYKRGNKSWKRFFLAVVLLNICPFVYFALVFIYLIPFTNSFPTFLEILSIALISLSVFAFHRFFLVGVTWKRYGNPFYTQYDLKRLINQKAIYPKRRNHFFAGILYLAISWMVFSIVVGLLWLLFIALVIMAFVIGITIHQRDD